MPIFTLLPAPITSRLQAPRCSAGSHSRRPATAAGGTYYHAELASPATQTRFVARDVVWACKDASCIAGQGTSRPLIMCSALAKAVGPVTSFTAGGKALDANDLARCNAVK
jgi:hypothetical protein